MLPSHVVAAFLKSWGNAWVTSTRMGGAPKPCPFCGQDDGDSIQHMVACPTFFAAAMPYMPAGYSQWPAQASTEQMLGVDSPSTATMAVRMVWHDVLMHSSNTIRRHPLPLQKVVVARVRALCRESNVLKRLLKEHRASGQQHAPPQLLDW